MIFGLFRVWKGKKIFCCAWWSERTTNKIFGVFALHFFLCHAPYKKRMANKLFTVRLK
jgi:hypothetical protein